MTTTEKLLVICVQERDGNSILQVRVKGRVIGRVLEDRPHEWVVVRDPSREPRYPTLEAVVQALLDTDARADPDSHH